MGQGRERIGVKEKSRTISVSMGRSRLRRKNMGGVQGHEMLICGLGVGDESCWSGRGS